MVRVAVVLLLLSGCSGDGGGSAYEAELRRERDSIAVELQQVRDTLEEVRRSREELGRFLDGLTLERTSLEDKVRKRLKEMLR